MKYIDLHCDSATVCFDKGYALSNGSLHVNLQKLGTSECFAQCFAIFTDGANARDKFEEYYNFFSASVRQYRLTLADCFHTLISPQQKPCAILTVENLGFTEGNEEEIVALKDRGVLMASLVWNNENDLAYPNGSAGGLKPAGRKTVELLDELKIIVDLSHLSDGGTDEILKNRKIPTIASHSNARAVCNVPRNLTDKQIKSIADCGGVIGVNFCKKFLGEGDPFDCVLRHLKHLINIGGEDVVAFGSDFDGIPTVDGLEGCEKMPALIRYIWDNLGARVTDKLCFENFARVLKEVRP
ncbi:MAG: membrane dipeptidase [Clostridia bacterium]|nr:membrane dipeptidase [Clostridia bacterium]